VNVHQRRAGVGRVSGRRLGPAGNVDIATAIDMVDALVESYPENAAGNMGPDKTSTPGARHALAAGQQTAAQ
jgi:hypothetical protein